MTELPSDKDQENLLQEFQYARDLFVHLLQDETPLVNLGYTAEQKVRARRALAPLQAEASVYLRPAPWAHLGDDEASIQLNFLKHGGYVLSAFDQIPHALWSRAINDKNLRARLHLLEGESAGTVVVIHMIPGDVDYNDIDSLVHHLYEGSDATDRTINLKKQGFLSDLESKVIPTTATYRASWIDEETKLDLVVETDLPLREHGEPSPWKEVVTWRRLHLIEYEGKSWMPFGKKPNVSRESTQRALEHSRGTVGKFILEAPPVE